MHPMAVRATEGRNCSRLGFEQRNSKDDADELKKSNGKVLRNGTSKGSPPGSPLSMMCEETTEEDDSFEIHVGRALDALREDYPHMLTNQPEFCIFDKEVEVIDPSGVKLHGLKNYKNAFRLMHAIVQVFYCPERSGLTFRMCYDTARKNIRVSWNAEVIPKAIFGGVRKPLHVDGISIYEISRKSGMITQHRIERLVVNDTPVEPQQGIFALLRNEHDESVPILNCNHAAEQPPPTNSLLEFRRHPLNQPSSLFDSEASSTSLAAVSAGDKKEVDDSYPGLDWDAYERKNAYRKKFGLEPLSPEEFLENEAVVNQMETQQRQRAASASAAAELTKQTKSRQQGFLNRLFGDLIPGQCESNFDCDRPEICCDFGFKKVCCASGTMVGNQVMQPVLVPVTVDIYPPGQEPRL